MSFKELTREEKSEYILVESLDSLLLVSKRRLPINEEVKEAAEKIDFQIKSFSEDWSSKVYLDNVGTQNAIKLILTLGGHCLTIRQFIDFCLTLDDGMKGKRKVYDGNKKLISSVDILYVFEELIAKRNPLRGEYLGAAFYKFKNKLNIATDFNLVGEDIRPRRIEPLEDFLALHDFIDLRSCNKQGMPKRLLLDDEIFFTPPHDGRVACFYTSKEQISLACVPPEAVKGISIRYAKKLEK